MAVILSEARLLCMRSAIARVSQVDRPANALSRVTSEVFREGSPSWVPEVVPDGVPWRA